MAGDIAAFLGTGGKDGGSHPLSQPAYSPDPTEVDSPAEEADEKKAGTEVDPAFQDLTNELFPDWPEEDAEKLQRLIDMRIQSQGM